MIKYLIIFLTTFTQLEASSFSLDKYEINIESNFLGEEIVIFGEKSSAHDLLIILEGKGEKVRLNEKVKKKILWTNKSTNYENIPNYFSIFSLPKKTINEIFLIQTVKDKHRLIADSSQKLFKIREALREKSLYFEKTLTEAENNLFFSRFKIPDNINSGLINIYFYEIINNKVIKVTQKKLTIEKIGFIQKIEQLLYAQSLAYVFALVLFAILFSFIFNYILRRK